eukprot:1064105-Amorphochlora_amoeboformis.AAC.1
MAYNDQKEYHGFYNQNQNVNRFRTQFYTNTFGHSGLHSSYNNQGMWSPYTRAPMSTTNTTQVGGYNLMGFQHPYAESQSRLGMANTTAVPTQQPFSAMSIHQQQRQHVLNVMSTDVLMTVRGRGRRGRDRR